MYAGHGRLYAGQQHLDSAFRKIRTAVRVQTGCMLLISEHGTPPTGGSARLSQPPEPVFCLLGPVVFLACAN